MNRLQTLVCIFVKENQNIAYLKMDLALIKYLTSPNWAKALAPCFEMPYFIELASFLQKERAAHKIIFPALPQVFEALNLCELNKVKVIIIGQDPYHQAGQANGLAFSVSKGQALPPSLKNIFKELNSDLNINLIDGDLSAWAKQGVLLLNTVLTVEQASPNAHQNKGWEIFTDQIIRLLNEQDRPLVFILWGKPAQSKIKLIDTTKHFCIQSAHPSPLAAYRGFFGSKPFSKTNNYLKSLGKAPIVW
jgi:uracil-DNA glycosylase